MTASFGFKLEKEKTKTSPRVQRSVRLAIAVTLLSGQQLAFAAGPVAFDGYTVSNGSVSAGCPATTSNGAPITSCVDTVSDNGMLQREITVGGVSAEAGKYIQFILTDIGVSGDAAAAAFTASRGTLNFTNEDFVKMNNRGAGIASQQRLIESTMVSATIEDRFEMAQEYEFGWARSGLTPWVSTFEDISQVDYSVNPTNPDVIFQSRADVISNNSLFSTDIDVGLTQFVDLTDANGTGNQGFKFKRVAGQFQNTAHTAPAILPGGTNGGNITWAVGEDISALWLGQNITNMANAGFDHVRYTNNTLPTQSTQLTNLGVNATNSPSSWSNPPFGPAPTLTAPTVTATATVSAPTALAPTLPSPASPTVITGATAVTLPLPYNNWTVSNGVFTVPACPATATCSAPIVNEAGVFQRNVTVAGVTYIQTIVTDSNATGDAAAAEFTANSLAFRAETFVKASSATGSGIASNLQIADSDLSYKNVDPTTNSVMPTTGGEFGYSTQLKTGWAHAAGSSDPLLVVDQRVTVQDNNFLHTTSMEDRFHMELGENVNDRKIDTSSVVGTTATADGGTSSIIIDPNNAAHVASCGILGGTVIGNSCVIPGTAGSGFNNPIMFNSSYVSGSFQTTSRVPDPFNPLLSNGGDIGWSAGDAIQATWVGGRYVTTDPYGPSVIGATSYTNYSTGDRTAIASVNLPTVTGSAGNPNPDSWAAPFVPPALSYSNTYTPPATPGP